MQRPARLTLVLTLALAFGVSAARAADAPGADPRGSFEAYRRFLAGGGPADPALFTAASLVHLARAPRAAGAAAARLAELDAAKPFRLVAAGERAALIPRARNSAIRPVLLERVAGTWRIDLVETEKSLEPGDKGGLRLRYRDSPYEAVLAYPPAVFPGALEPLDLFGEDPASAIARLSGVRSTASRLRLAEILLRNCWLVDEALPIYEQAIRGAAEPWLVVEVFGTRALVIGQTERAIPLLEHYEPEADRLLAQLHRRAGHFEVWQRYEQRSLLDHFRRQGILKPNPGPETGPGYQRL